MSRAVRFSDDISSSMSCSESLERWQRKNTWKNEHKRAQSHPENLRFETEIAFESENDVVHFELMKLMFTELILSAHNTEKKAGRKLTHEFQSFLFPKTWFVVRLAHSNVAETTRDAARSDDPMFCFSLNNTHGAALASIKVAESVNPFVKDIALL